MPSWNIPGDPFVLLSTFEALLEHRSVVKAAETLGITQSAVSKHLSKLRTWLDDELFIRTSEGMQPTLKALSLTEQIRHILQNIESLTEQTLLDPSMLQGEFILSTTDEVRQRLLEPLITILEQEAPKLRITSIHLSPDYAYPYLETGRVQLVVSVNWHAPAALKQKKLWQDSFVCVCNKHHALADQPLSIEAYASCSHLLVAPLGHARGYIDDYLLQHNKTQRQIRLSVPNFYEVTEQLIGTQNLVTLPLRVAEHLCNSQNLCIKPLPFEVPPIDYYMFWHQRFTNHPVNEWMRHKILKCIQK